MKRILSLCDRTGIWSDPYREAGYEVVRVDIEHGMDVRLLEYPGEVHGILAAPPCTHFSKAGAHAWERKGEAAILEGLSVVDACLRLVAMTRPAWRALENPIGRLRRWLGPPRWSFQPCDFGDPFTKRTLLWGDFGVPAPAEGCMPVGVVLEGRAGGRDRTTLLSSKDPRRSETPKGFARAFFLANP